MKADIITTANTTRAAYRAARRAYRGAIHADRQEFEARWADANDIYRDQRAPLPWPTMDRQRQVLASLPTQLAAAVQSRPARPRLSEATLRLAAHQSARSRRAQHAAAIAGALDAIRAYEAHRAAKQTEVAA